MKFHSLFAAALAAGVAFAASPSLAQDYPTKEIQGIIQWGAGGSTDTVMRAVTPKAEEVLGQGLDGRAEGDHDHEDRGGQDEDLAYLDQDVSPEHQGHRHHVPSRMRYGQIGPSDHDDGSGWMTWED